MKFSNSLDCQPREIETSIVKYWWVHTWIKSNIVCVFATSNWCLLSSKESKIHMRSVGDNLLLIGGIVPGCHPKCPAKNPHSFIHSLRPPSHPPLPVLAPVAICLIVVVLDVRGPPFHRDSFGVVSVWSQSQFNFFNDDHQDVRITLALEWCLRDAFWILEMSTVWGNSANEEIDSRRQ